MEKNIFDLCGEIKQVYAEGKEYNVSLTLKELDYLAELIKMDYQFKYGRTIDSTSFEFKVCNKLMTCYMSTLFNAIGKDNLVNIVTDFCNNSLDDKKVTL